MRKFLLAAGVMAALTGGAMAQPVPPPGYGPVPALRPEGPRPPPPGPRYRWAPGYWAWAPGRGYAWRPGYWAIPPVAGGWVPGHWGPRGGWIPAHWAR